MPAANFFQLLRVHGESDPDIVEPQAVVILSILGAGKRAARTGFIPAQGGDFRPVLTN
jgi:hypothetical protein